MNTVRPKDSLGFFNDYGESTVEHIVPTGAQLHWDLVTVKAMAFDLHRVVSCRWAQSNPSGLKSSFIISLY